MLIAPFRIAVIITISAASASVAQASEFEHLSLLVGCWEGDTDGASTSESWGRPGGGTMLGTSMTIREGVMRGFEFLKIQRDGDTIAYTPYVGGEASVSFMVDLLDQRQVRFVNPNHDFPQSIHYLREGDTLKVTLSGSGREFSYVLAAVDCR